MVIKVKDPKGIYLEIFSSEYGSRNIRRLHQEKLTEKINAQVQLDQHLKSLFVVPSESQKKLKILAPTLDANLRPYLNAFTWNIDSQTLELSR